MVFRSNYNTELIILHALDFILQSLDAKILVINLYIDILRAFDSRLDHKILLDKLFLISFRGISHLWLSSYLTNRFQYVEISGNKLNMHMLNKGVPQGLIFGPLLFLIYLNDLVYVSSKLHFILLADGTTVLLSDPSLKTSFNVASNVLQIVFYWVIANKLFLNVKKPTLCRFLPVYVVMT